MNPPSKRQRLWRLPGISLGFALTLVFSAHARAATATVERPPTAARSLSGSLLLAVTAPALADSARRDFELNVTRGLRFSGLDVVAESTDGAAQTLASCSDPGCLRETGSARGVAALVRANVDAPPAEPRDGAKRNYSIKVELFSASTGLSVVAQEAGCAGCTSGVATHLAYLLAAEVGQKFARANHPIASAGQKAATPVGAGARTGTAMPVAVAATVAAVPAPATTAVASDDRALLAHRERVTRVGAGILGGLGAAALASGAVLLLRGPQSTCPSLPASACGRTYDDSPTGWLLAGTGAAAIASAIVWAAWPSSHESDATPNHLAIVPGGLLAPGSVVVSGRF